ncbi:MAG TPA: bifunctional [glutamate--ammonia ligase]-adenylyl-L-tyrosine phosphorylase/[glutamate--ammonia-ligase] adenylyltransferase [Usitatibacter sp.]|nr:bifunctional [glutamate--ammonia ligase]-adenylyl-L-tyrosine phosphorylase/[glutamate--ammonia-ligase] adenylyltransferase [Usitatibacter sp.]
MMDAPAASFRAAFDRTLRLSRYVARAAGARPALVEELEARGARPYGREEMRAALADGPDLAQRLRRLRERVMVRLAHRDLNGLAPLDEVFETMTALAEESIAAAAREAHRGVAAAHGEPANGARLVVAALGKLGGAELNVSSDVDLVFLYPAEGETAGERPLAHSAFFAAVGRALIALLSEATEDGQAFRVDMRLRPFGDSGPLATSLAALEEYFIAHARPWERYAWLKARGVAGSDEGVRERVEPFVYRRYLDYGMLESMRELHARIFEAAIRRRKADDIKVGAGGIREIEFAAQLFQMVRGGRDAALRTTSTRAALAAIGERGLVAPERVAALLDAYAFLRRLEHRLQYYDDQQTQALPRSEEQRELVADAMDCPGWEAFSHQLEVHRGKVQEAFNALFDARPEHERAASLSAWLYDPQASADPEGLAEDLAEAGIVDANEVARRLVEFTRSRRYRALSATIRAHLEKLLPLLVAAVAREGGRETTAARLLDLLEAIGGRDAYHSLLVEQPQVLARAARLVAKSAWAARLLARHPILLDELTRSAASFTATDWAAERAALGAECAERAGDVEALLDHLRHYKQRQVLRFTIADLEGELPVMALSDELTALADTILDVTLVEAARSVGIDVGPRRLGGDDAPPGVPGFCIVAYGKLGAKELGYGSDLDMIFLHDETASAGPEKLARAAQRVNTWLTMLTSAGVLYETDLRLRPDGAAGLLVSSLASFSDYQRTRAWTWEHQALTRARACAGDPDLGARFERVRDEVLAMPRDRAKLFADIAAMRRKMRGEQKSLANDLKHVEGGVIDLEFCVQALVLAEGPAHPQLRENKGNHTLLHRAAAVGLVDAGIASAAADAYLAMRRRSHEGALNDEDTVRLAEGELAPEREAVRRLWAALFGAP